MDQFAGEMLAPELSVEEHFYAVSSDHEPILKMLRGFGLGLETRLDEFSGHLSGGERQIVALLSVVASGANVLCLDEFTAALDRESVRVVRNIIGQLQEAGDVSIVGVSHRSDIPDCDRRVTLILE